MLCETEQVGPMDRPTIILIQTGETESHRLLQCEARIGSDIDGLPGSYRNILRASCFQMSPSTDESIPRYRVRAL